MSEKLCENCKTEPAYLMVLRRDLTLTGPAKERALCRPCAHREYEAWNQVRGPYSAFTINPLPAESTNGR